MLLDASKTRKSIKRYVVQLNQLLKDSFFASSPAHILENYRHSRSPQKCSEPETELLNGPSRKDLLMRMRNESG